MGEVSARDRRSALAVTRLLVRDLAQLVTPAGRDGPLRGAALGEVEVLEDAFVVCEEGRIAATGRMAICHGLRAT